jgi:hypothetical protein
VVPPRRRRGEHDSSQPSNERLYTSERLETDEGTIVIQQQNVGRDQMRGGAEWPDPDTPPPHPASGAA